MVLISKTASKENVSKKKQKKKLTNKTKYSKIEKVVEAWLSLVERYIRDVEVASSNLVASIGQTGNVGNGIFGSFWVL